MSKREPLRIAYFGTSPFAATILEMLCENNLAPILVVTQPDAPKGRGLTLAESAVKEKATELGLDVVTPESLKIEHVPDEITNSEWDLFIVAAYGIFIPKRILALPKHGCLNVHPSLLPKLRGASPIVSAILNDEQHSVGTSIILLDEEMDHGPIVAQARITPDEWPIGKNTLEPLLAEQSGILLAESIRPWVSGEIEAEPQNHDEATFTRKITKEDGLIDLSGDAYQNYLKYCALEGWPGTYFFIEKNGKSLRVKIIEAEFVGGHFTPLRVTPEGKSEMPYEDFMRGINKKSG